MTAIAQFRADFARFLLTKIEAELLNNASRLAEEHALRGYDAVQLAAALAVEAEYKADQIPFVFVSADGELNLAAAAVGLQVLNPNSYP